MIIPGEKIHPESLTSSNDGRIIIGSISTRTIFAVKPGNDKVEAWILPDQESTLGVFGWRRELFQAGVRMVTVSRIHSSAPLP